MTKQENFRIIILVNKDNYNVTVQTDDNICRMCYDGRLCLDNIRCERNGE